MAYATVGEVIARAATQVGALSLTPAQIAAFDPFASSEPNVVLMLDLVRSLGSELSTELPDHLHKEGTILTAAGALSYSLPADFAAMVDDTGWDRSNDRKLFGPVTPQYEAYLRAWNDGIVAAIPYRLQGLNLTFPVAPVDGLTLKYTYVSSYWLKSAAAPAPDKAAPTVRTDVIWFDDELVLLGLKLNWLEEKNRDTTTAAPRFNAALAKAKGTNRGGATLSLNGGASSERFVDSANLPSTSWGT